MPEKRPDAPEPQKPPFVEPEKSLAADPVRDAERYGRRIFREQYAGDRGAAILAQELVELRILEDCHTPEEFALRNYATHVIRDKIGIKTAEQWKRVVRFLLDVGE